MTVSPEARVDQPRSWFNKSVEEVVAEFATDAESGLPATEAASRLAQHGANVIASEPSPSVWAVALIQLKDSMNLMLIAVTVVSMLIQEWSTAMIVALLVVLNVVMGTQQEMKARASVDALSKMTTPQAKVVRDGTLMQVSATDLVPGDIVNLESGDIVPADGRLIRSATLETQEAALTGESAPISKDPSTIDRDEVALGDRANMLFQNTSVTRGTGAMVVTETGMGTQMGQIATMLSAVAPSRSPLQKELDSLTKVLGAIAWVAVAIIVGLGLYRGQTLESVLLLGVAMAISAIPTGLPTFVQAMLAFGAKELAENKAIVKNLTDVETLGATSAINSDKTGTLTMNEMMVRSLYMRGHWYTVSGEGYAKTGSVRAAVGDTTPEFTKLAYGLTLCSDATVSDDGAVIGDPTEAALVVLAAKLGVDAEVSRRELPRVAEVPFDSAYKFMATFHNIGPARDQLVELVKGGPDVVLDRCTTMLADDGAVPMAEVLDSILAANREMSEKGLRVLAFAVRDVSGREDEVVADPMSFVGDLQFVGMVGIIDPLRPSAVEAVRVARQAGIEVRMITGDHAITASAIGAELGLAPGAISGAEIAAMSDEDLTAALPGLHVFGRVTPQDKLRLAKLMQPGRHRGHDRGCGQRRRRAQAGRHRRGDGLRVRGHQAGRQDDPHRRQLRHPGHRRAPGPQHLREDRQLRPLPDEPTARPGAAVPDRQHLRHQRRHRPHPADGAVPQLLHLDLPRRRDHAGAGPARSHDQAAPGPEPEAGQPGVGAAVGVLRRHALPGHPDCPALRTRGAQR